MRFLPTSLFLLFAASACAEETVYFLVQRSPLAGFQYYAGKKLWGELKLGDPLTLVREPHNIHDPHAVRVEWQGIQLGYLPRAENEAVAAALDRGETLAARIGALVPHRNPWRRIRIDVYVRL